MVINDFAARLIASIASNRKVAAVYNELLGSSGQMLYVSRVTDVLAEDECVHSSRLVTCDGVGEESIEAEARTKGILTKCGSACSPLPFCELLRRGRVGSAPKIFVGYIKREYDPHAKGHIGELSTIINPKAQEEPKYWSAGDFLIALGPESTQKRKDLVVVR